MRRKQNKKLIELTELDHYEEEQPKKKYNIKQVKNMILWKQNP